MGLPQEAPALLRDRPEPRGNETAFDQKNGPPQNQIPPAATKVAALVLGEARTAFYLLLTNAIYPVRMAEARRANRHIVLKAGTIKFGGNTVQCLVRNLSTSGAALEIPGQARIPARFMLQVPADGLHLPCRALWRNQYRIGVAFG